MPGKNYKKELIQKANEQAIEAYFADMEQFTAENLPHLKEKAKSINESIDQQFADLGNKYENIEVLLKKETDDAKRQRAFFGASQSNANYTENKKFEASLTEEEKNTISSYRKENKELKIKRDNELYALNDETAFHTAKCVSFEFAEAMQKAYDAQAANKSLKVDPVQAFVDFESPNFTEQDKLDTLLFMQRYIDKAILPRLDLPRTDLNLSAEEQKAADARYEELNEFGSKLGLFWIKTDKNGSKKLKFDLYSDDAADANRSLGSALRYKTRPNDPRFLKETNLVLKDFCKDASEKLLEKMLEKGQLKVTGTHTAERNKLYEQLDQRMKDYKAIENAVGSSEKDGISVLQNRLNHTKLSFGRKGSPEFQNMKSAYEALQEKLQAYAEDPGKVDSAKLREQLKEVSAKATEYLNKKNNAMNTGEVSFKVDEATGKRVAKNSNTQKRMEFAEFLKAEADRMNNYFEEKAAQPARKLKETFDHAKENIKEGAQNHAKKSLMTLEDLQAENAKKKNAPKQKSKVSLLIEKEMAERRAKQDKVIEKYDLNSGKGRTR